MSGIAKPAIRVGPLSVALAAGLLLLLAGTHLVGAVLDFAATVRYPAEIDYGEGIVWQQAVLMLGPRAYGASQDLPFIVFHYPPLFYLVVRAIMALHVDPLAAGRFVSGASALASGGLVGALVLACLRDRAGPVQLAIAGICAALTVSVHAMHEWAGLMRVDTLPIWLGLLANLIAVRARGRVWVLTLALLFGVAAVYSKQTQLAAGVSVFLVALVPWPRQTLIASALALAAGLLVLLVLQLETHGFLLNIVGYNLNTYNLQNGISVLMRERTSLPYALIMVATAGYVLWGLRDRERLRAFRAGRTDVVAQVSVAVHFALACGLALAVFKNGSNYNYLLDPLSVGCVLVGVALCLLVDYPSRFVGLAALLAISINTLPFRIFHDDRLAEWSAREAKVVDMIRQADKPVAAEQMTLVMRAGKSLTYEPAIVEELVATGRYDPAPLLQMFREHRFAFVLSRWTDPMGGPLIAAAIKQYYPRAEILVPGMFIRYPAD